MKLKITAASVPGFLTPGQIESGTLDTYLASMDVEPYHYSQALIKWAKKNYPFIGEGSSRITFKLDESHALKIALNPAGVVQNKVESHIAQHLHDLPITQVHYLGKKAYYMIVDFAHELDFDDFEKVYGIPFEKLEELTTNLRDTVSVQRTKFFRELTPITQKLLVSLQKHHLKLYDIFREDQWGDLNSKPVLIDYGLDPKAIRHYDEYGVKAV